VQGATLKFVAAQLFSKASKHKNPKVLQEAALWLAVAGAEFGGRALDPKAMVPNVKALLMHTNAGVRQAGIELAVVMYQTIGPPLQEVLAAGLKPATMATVLDRFKQVQAADAPTRVEKAATKVVAKAAASRGTPGA
jgi:hypothetical protein